MNNLTFHTLEQPHDHFIRSLRTALVRHDETITGPIKTKRLGVSVNNSSGEIVAGIYGWLEWGWLYIDLLWVNTEPQNQGIGKKLLIILEQLAHKQGVNRAYLDTSNFEAPDFYKKYGYEIFPQMDITADDGRKYIRYMMHKLSI